MFTSITEAERQRRLRSGRWKHAHPEPQESKLAEDLHDLGQQKQEKDYAVTPWPSINWLLAGLAYEGEEFPF